MIGRIKFYNKDIRLHLRHKNSLKNFIKEIFVKENFLVHDLKFIFCTDEYLKTLNQKYLNHNTLTDVITFNLSETQKNVNAEIYISIQRVKENSVKFRTLFQDEIHRIIFHGILHLCGYTDKKSLDKKKMTQLEDSYISSYNLIVSRETSH